MIRILEDVFPEHDPQEIRDWWQFWHHRECRQGWPWNLALPSEIVDDDSEDIWDHDKIALSEAKRSSRISEVRWGGVEQVYLEGLRPQGSNNSVKRWDAKVKDLEKDIVCKYKTCGRRDYHSRSENQILGKEVLLIDAEGNGNFYSAWWADSERPLSQRRNVRAIVHKVEMVNGNPIIGFPLHHLCLSSVCSSRKYRKYMVWSPSKQFVNPVSVLKLPLSRMTTGIDPVGACAWVWRDRAFTPLFVNREHWRDQLYR